MSKKVSISIADSVYNEIEEIIIRKSMTRSELYEEFLRKGLELYKKED